MYRLLYGHAARSSFIIILVNLLNLDWDYDIRDLRKYFMEHKAESPLINIINIHIHYP